MSYNYPDFITGVPIEEGESVYVRMLRTDANEKNPISITPFLQATYQDRGRFTLVEDVLRETLAELHALPLNLDLSTGAELTNEAVVIAQTKWDDIDEDF